MSVRAKTCILLGKLPSEVKDLSYEECLFLLAINEESKSIDYKRQLEDIGSMLGTIWDIEEAKKVSSKEPKVNQDKIILPLTYAIGLSGMDGFKNIHSYIEKARASAKNRNNAFDNASELSKDEYLSIFGRNVK